MTAVLPPVVTLQAGHLRLALRPDLGAALAGLWWDELPVLQSRDPLTMTTPRQSAGFVLVPYSNRIGFRRFQWQGQDHEIAHNGDASAHALHGVAWRRPWQVQQQQADAVSLRLDHMADADWPFAFTLRQQLNLLPDGLRLHLSLTSTDRRVQPVGLGWHPYFPKRAGSHIQAGVTHRWARDDSTWLPTQRQPIAGLDGDVAQLALDHCFDGWPGTAVITDEHFNLRLTASSSRLVVYTPQQLPFFCVEPVSHVNNAIQMADPLAQGLSAVQPGETVDFQAALSVQRV